MKSLLFGVVVLIVAATAAYIFLPHLGDISSNESDASRSFVEDEMLRTSNVPAVDVTANVIARWEPSLVQATCAFTIPNITKTGIGILYTDTIAARTFGIFSINSSVALIEYDDTLRSFDRCEFRSLDGRMYHFEFGPNMRMAAGSTEKDGIIFMWDDEASTHTYSSNVGDVTNFCVHKPKEDSEIYLVGLEQGSVVASKTVIASSLLTDQGQRWGYFLGPKMPPRQGLAIAVDPQSDCILGIVSRDQSMLIPTGSPIP